MSFHTSSPNTSRTKGRKSGQRSIQRQNQPGTQRDRQPSDADPSKLVCAACRAGPFSYEGFRRAILKDFEDVDPPRSSKKSLPNQPRFKYIYTTTWESIAESAAHEKCNWCRLLIQNRDGLPDAQFPRGGPDEEVEVRIEIRIQSPVDWMEVTNDLNLYLNDYQAASYMIYAESDNVAAEEIGNGDHFRLDPSYVDYEKAKEWLKDCSTHEHCSKIGTTTLPTRVIDCSDPTKPHLVETQHRQGQFCTLSYVWGGDQRAKTTKANIKKHINEGFGDGLSQTIVDAIVATHNLGMQYLWVDALCIIQDSLDDKLIELANMAHIYQEAYVSLSVVSAFRADQGFLPDGREHVMLPFYMKDSAGSSHHRVGRMLMKYYIRRQNPRLGYKHQTVEVFEPLTERGWCFQESMLAPRKLIFQPPNVRFECRTYIKDITRASEGGMDDPPLEANVPAIFQSSTSERTDEEDDNEDDDDDDDDDEDDDEEDEDEDEDEDEAEEEDDEEEGEDEDKDKDKDKDKDDLYDHWAQLLFDYTERKITVPSDKLVAFSSIVEVFQKAFKNDEYIAGLWRSRLIDGLLWEPFGDIGPDVTLRPRTAVYRAPTWSWASVDLSVQAHRQHMFETPSMDYEAELVGCDVKPKSDIHPFGEISGEGGGAKLEMRVKMHPLMLDGRKCRFTERKGTLSGDTMQSMYTSGAWVAPDGNCLKPSPKTKTKKNSANDDNDNGEVQFDCAEGSEQDRDMDFHVIALRAGRKWGDRLDRGGWVMGLLVLKCEDRIETYRRVARIEVFHWPEWFDSVPLKTVTLV